MKVEEIHCFRHAGIKDLTASLRDYVSFYIIAANGHTPVMEAELRQKRNANISRNMAQSKQPAVLFKRAKK